MQITTGMIIGMFGGIGGALLTLTVQFWRDWAARRRQAAVLRALLISELEMMWFDLTGSYRLSSAKFFSCRTEVWDTYKQQLPNLLAADDVKVVYGAYYWAKELQRFAAIDASIDYAKASDHAREAVEGAIRKLAGPNHSLVKDVIKSAT